MTQSPSFRASAVIVAAGSSTRMGGKVRKPFLMLNGKPILTWTIAGIAKVPGLQQIVLVTRPEDRESALLAAKKSRVPKTICLDTADGGARRQDSVFNGLKACASSSDLVLIHDAARPFAGLDAMEQACRRAGETGAAILACRVKDTVKREQLSQSPDQPVRIESTVPRAGLWLAQTPQVFRRELIIQFYEKLTAMHSSAELTDDASVCEFFRHPVELIESSETNLKVTRPEDLAIAAAYIKLKLVHTALAK